jgi:hypothetical protein
MVMKLLNKALIAYVLAATPLAAQTTPTSRPPQPQVPQPSQAAQASPNLITDLNAYQMRDTFQQVLRQYPPSLSEVLRLDPSLLANAAYLAPYPNLAAFLNQHPEIAHNPGFFVGEQRFGFNRSEIRSSSARIFEEMMAGIAAFSAGLIVVGVVIWIFRTVIDHRRWLRVSKIQSEVHSKLLDRFTSNQDLLAYVQTPAGKRFLESAPISIDPASRSLTAPLGRIFFSVQAGVVLALAGIGLSWISRQLTDQDVTQPLFVVGVLALAVGLGFVLSAVIAYALSRRLGLFDQPPLGTTSDNAGVSPPNA